MSKTIAYIRVSSKGQNLDRQIEDMKKLGIEEKNIYSDKQSRKRLWPNRLFIRKKMLRKRRYVSNRRTWQARKKWRPKERMAIFYG